MKIPSLLTLTFLALAACFGCRSAALNTPPAGAVAAAPLRPRVIVSTDIGGTDDDDFQSMIHYLMYADRFQTEGLIASPYGDGRKQHIEKIINFYAQDYPKLKAHSNLFTSPDELRALTKQGAIERAPGKGWTQPTEGSEWIIKCARRKSAQPLWVLVWGGIEDLAQALHDAPDIAGKLRVYYIGGPNKKWGANAYQYVARNFPNLWMIESNATYRGLFEEKKTPNEITNKGFYEQYIKGVGAMGRDFGNYYQGQIKMGDSPAVAYLLHGSPEHPDSSSWGGSYVPLPYSARRIFDRPTTFQDEIPTFGVVEWVVPGPDSGPNASDVPSVWLEVDKQKFAGYYEGGGRYRLRFVSKAPGRWTYTTQSEIPALNGLHGAFTTVNPWPGQPHPNNIGPLKGWWSDRTGPADFAGAHQGARTIQRWREDFLLDWAKRWAWLAEK